MKTGRLKTGVIAIALLSAACEAKAQDKVEASAGADLVSGYIWRGQDLGGVSIQPGLTLSYKGFSVSAWGSVGLESSDTKEMDLTLGYTVGGFSISVTDYWFNGGKGYLHYDAHDTSHVFEAQIGYDFGPVAVNWYTNFAGADYMKYDGSRAYSSYISVAAPFKLGGLDWAAEIGATPWETSFYNATDNCPGSDGFTVCDISLSASKEVRITDSFSLPLFVKATWNPRTEGAYFVAGISF